MPEDSNSLVISGSSGTLVLDMPIENFAKRADVVGSAPTATPDDVTTRCQEIGNSFHHLLRCFTIDNHLIFEHRCAGVRLRHEGAPVTLR